MTKLHKDNDQPYELLAQRLLDNQQEVAKLFLNALRSNKDTTSAASKFFADIACANASTTTDAILAFETITGVPDGSIPTFDQHHASPREVDWVDFGRNSSAADASAVARESQHDFENNEPTSTAFNSSYVPTARTTTGNRISIKPSPGRYAVFRNNDDDDEEVLLGQLAISITATESWKMRTVQFHLQGTPRASTQTAAICELDGHDGAWHVSPHVHSSDAQVSFDLTFWLNSIPSNREALYTFDGWLLDPSTGTNLQLHGIREDDNGDDLNKMPFWSGLCGIGALLGSSTKKRNRARVHPGNNTQDSEHRAAHKSSKKEHQARQEEVHQEERRAKEIQHQEEHRAKQIEQMERIRKKLEEHDKQAYEQMLRQDWQQLVREREELRRELQQLEIQSIIDEAHDACLEANYQKLEELDRAHQGKGWWEQWKTLRKARKKANVGEPVPSVVDEHRKEDRDDKGDGNGDNGQGPSPKPLPNASHKSGGQSSSQKNGSNNVEKKPQAGRRWRYSLEPEHLEGLLASSLWSIRGARDTVARFTFARLVFQAQKLVLDTLPVVDHDANKLVVRDLTTINWDAIIKTELAKVPTKYEGLVEVPVVQADFLKALETQSQSKLQSRLSIPFAKLDKTMLEVAFQTTDIGSFLGAVVKSAIKSQRVGDALILQSQFVMYKTAEQRQGNNSRPIETRLSSTLEDVQLRHDIERIAAQERAKYQRTLDALNSAAQSGHLADAKNADTVAKGLQISRTPSGAFVNAAPPNQAAVIAAWLLVMSMSMIANNAKAKSESSKPAMKPNVASGSKVGGDRAAPPKAVAQSGPQSVPDSSAAVSQPQALRDPVAVSEPLIPVALPESNKIDVNEPQIMVGDQGSGAMSAYVNLKAGDGGPNLMQILYRQL